MAELNLILISTMPDMFKSLFMWALPPIPPVRLALLLIIIDISLSSTLSIPAAAAGEIAVDLYRWPGTGGFMLEK